MGIIDYLEISNTPSKYILEDRSTVEDGNKYVILPDNNIDLMRGLLITKFPDRQDYINGCFSCQDVAVVSSLIMALAGDNVYQAILAKAIDKPSYSTMDISPKLEEDVIVDIKEEIDVEPNPEVEYLQHELEELSKSNTRLVEENTEFMSEIETLKAEVASKSNSIIILEGRIEEYENSSTNSRELEELRTEEATLRQERDSLLEQLEVAATELKKISEDNLHLRTVIDSMPNEPKVKKEEDYFRSEDINTLIHQLIKEEPERCKRILIGAIYSEATRSKTSDSRDLTILCSIIYSELYGKDLGGDK